MVESFREKVRKTERARLFECFIILNLVSNSEPGGFGGSERHDPHILYTLSAVQGGHTPDRMINPHSRYDLQATQILALVDELDKLDADEIVECEPFFTLIPAKNPCLDLPHQSLAWRDELLQSQIHRHQEPTAA
eukprot:scaffold22698_cov29-Prasinocladus_malaysianus.AAC.1